MANPKIRFDGINSDGKAASVYVDVVQNSAGGFSLLSSSGNFIPSQYDSDLTMNGTAQSVALATGVTAVYFANRGATTEAIRVAFGTSAANAEANLTIAAAAATTGHYIGAAADVGSQSAQVLGVPSSATHYAVANAVAADVQVVSVTQGV